MSESTTMKCRPILFSGAMIRAILSGAKTQTRRIVKDSHFKRLGLERDGEFIYTTEGQQWNGEFEGGQVPWCPYGTIGERLWVRETFWLRQWGNTFDGIGVDYKAGGDPMHLSKRPEKVGRMCRWMPSIHMPRWASRITLEIASVRVERLNEISEGDAMAEGVERIEYGPNEMNGMPVHPHTSYYWEAFKELWESINGAGAWGKNPWVWVVEFEKVTQ